MAKESPTPPPSGKPTSSKAADDAILKSLSACIQNEWWQPAKTIGELYKIANPDLASSKLLHLASDWYSLSGGSENARKLEEQIQTLRNDLRSNAEALRDTQKSKEELKAAKDRLEQDVANLRQKEELAFLLARVSPLAQQRLLADEDFRNQFFSESHCSAFVLAVDIRRSTELMLKARSPQGFALFISKLCSELEEIIKMQHGVFDKFTGDGVLAFFPEFFSGPDAGFRALVAAQQCQNAFDRHYKSARTSFTTVLKDVGLGIGIDYGPVNLLRVAGGLTVVGTPVVYACRLSGAPAGHTFVNQPAFEVLSQRFGKGCYAKEAELEIKHEGTILCYDVGLSNETLTPTQPDWIG